MHAMLVKDDFSLLWQEVAEPDLPAEAVMIDVSHAAVNRADLLQRQGLYPPPAGAPEWMGLEVAGTIAALGEDAAAHGTWQVGQTVCALLPGGGYAERVVCDARHVLPIPDGLSAEAAASLPEVFATAYLNLFIEADLQAGERVLIQAGASGVGIAAIQLAKAFGAEVVCTVGGPVKAAAVAALGADVVIDRHAEDHVAVMKRLADMGKPVSVVLDCVGGDSMGQALQHMAPGGRWVLIATLGGVTTQLPLRVLLKRGLRLIGSTLRSRSAGQKAVVLEALRERVWPLLGAGSIKPVVHAVLPMAQAATAHRILEANENIGKVVLRIAQTAS